MADLRPLDRAVAIDLGKEPEFDLGGMRVKPPELAVLMNGERREMQRRVMQVLVTLARARPDVVSRDKLVELCWGGRIVGDDAINRCVLALRHLAAEFTPKPFAIETVPRIGHRLIENGTEKEPGRSTWRVIVAPSAVLVMVAILIFITKSELWSERRSDRIPTVLVSPEAIDGSSRQLANDLAVRLGSWQPVQPAPMRLVTRTASSVRPDLVVHVVPLKDAGSGGAGLVLTHERTRTVLWSKEFVQRSKIADLEEQIAITLARVVGCTAEGWSNESPRLEADLKAYLTACVAMSDDMDDFRGISQSLERLVESSPRFVAGWALLLRAETNVATDPRIPGGEAVIPKLRQHIAAARKLDPHLADAYVAEAALLPQQAFLARGKMLDEAVKYDPRHAMLRRERSLFLRAMGRNHDALMDAQESVKIDPLSPYFRLEYIVALATAGRLDGARRELREAERLWPDAKSVVSARVGYNLRWGDPREALRIIQTNDGPRRTPGILEPFLRARIDPSSRNIDEALRHGRMVLREVPGSIVMYSQVLAEFDRKEELLDILLNWKRMDIIGEVTAVLFRPAFADTHKDRRFMQAAKHLGLVNYWRTTGEWPDFCYAADLPYDCKAEAQKLEA